MPLTDEKPKEKLFTRYQMFMVALLSFLQFTIILDFMVLSPLGALLMDKLSIGPSQFGLVVSAYAFSAGASGLLAAGFADKFDRKKLLVFFYIGFLIGTVLCALAPDYQSLMAARIVTGIFGGVIGSISMAIITDIFKMEVRGRVMGFVQMSFAASQVLGIPIGLLLANLYGWHSPFWMIAGVGGAVGVIIVVYMQPIVGHLAITSDRNPFQHLIKTLTEPFYVRAFLGTVLLATGGFMMMPFGSAFSIHNLGLKMEQLPLLYGITGVCTFIFGPLIGKFSDKIGKFNIFLIGSIISMVMVMIYVHLGVTPFGIIVAVNTIMFIGITARIISSSALMTAIPEPQDRGAFMSINSSIQQISGGVAAAVAGIIVVQTPGGKLERYDTLGYVVIASMIIATTLMYVLNQHIQKKMAQKAAQNVPPPVAV
jgi:predicted MFS family arabinose efflux permease